MSDESEFAVMAEESDFVQKYGAIEVEYFEPPRQSTLFTKPYALNYFHQGKLFRTRNERTSSTLELFLDLLYVGIVASILEPLVEKSDGKALLRYLILFFPVFTVWFDITSFMNYYFNDDLTQRLFILWITILLMIYANGTSYVLDGDRYTAMCVVPYMLCRISVGLSALFYSVHVPEHCTQLRFYGGSILVVSPIWIAVIFIGVRAKIGLSIALLFLEQVFYSASSHPRVKTLLNVSHGTLLNIEHFVERFSSFYVIAIGEFLFTIVSGHPIGEGITVKLWKAVLILMIAYVFMWLYFNGDCSNKAIHGLRRSATTLMLWIYIHIPMIASLILAADALSLLLKLEEIPLKKVFEVEAEVEAEAEEEINLYGLSFYFTGCILVLLVSLSIMAFCDKPLDRHVRTTKIFRIGPRIPAAVIIFCLSFAELKPAGLIGLTTLILAVLFGFEVFLRSSYWDEADAKCHSSDDNS